MLERKELNVCERNYRTDIEQLMYDALKKNKIKFSEQFPIRCKYGYILDFCIPKLKIIIECDGEAWHKKGNAHDRKRDGYLRSNGWLILRFRGKEIKNNIDTCIKKIKTHIDERR